MNGINEYKYLNHINSIADFKALPRESMEALAQEIRQELVYRVSENGGHLASNLGVVELTMALHRVFDSPKDHIIFDVGHQSYVHKMLTGRLADFDTLRKAGGISGFTNRSESIHDCFGSGHSSTSLSAALGFAVADKLSDSESYTIAVIGDGAYTGGMIHEALNNCRKDLKLLIIMNENEMSISKNIGRFAVNLSKIRNTPGYFKTKRATGYFLSHIPLIGKPIFRFIRSFKMMLKNVMYGSNYFESMGLTYLGPIDGNDYDAVEKLLQEAKKLNESVVVHIKTKKGKGYEPAEKSPAYFHGMPPKNDMYPKRPNFSHVMGNELVCIGREDSRICAVTAAMCDGTGLEFFRDQFPKRFFDVGIAEEHALTYAAGLAANGMKPFVAIYSTFLQRGFDNIIHDIALQNLPVTICVDRAGLNASDGATHHGIFDVSFLSQIPNLTIYTPITDDALRASLHLAAEQKTPCAVRYPSGVCSEIIEKHFYPNGFVILQGVVSDYTSSDVPDALIITHGRIVSEALNVQKELRLQGIRIGILLLEMLKPYEETATRIISLLPNSTCPILFLEEEIRNGGMGMLMQDALKRRGALIDRQTEILAVDDHFVTDRKSGEHIYDSAHISAPYIEEALKRMLGNGDSHE